MARKLQNKLLTAQDGITLIEMMIAAVIFVVGILGIIGIQGSILIGNDFGGSNTVARSLVSDRLNSLLFTAYTGPFITACPVITPFCYRDIAGAVPGPSTQPYANIDDFGVDVGPANPNGKYQRDWDVQPAPAPYAASAKLIQVRVTWRDKQVEGKSLTAPRRSLVYSSVYPQP